VDGTFDEVVFLPFLQIVKAPAEIGDGALRPVVVVDDLHFQIDDGIIIHLRLDVEDHLLFLWVIREGEGIDHVDTAYFVRHNVQIGADQRFQDIRVGLEQKFEKIVTCHPKRERSGE
jgi:hypothetical protein